MRPMLERHPLTRLVLLMPVLLWIQVGDRPWQREIDYSWAHEHKLVAHALGSIGGKIYTNSQEAFETNYRLGHRVFEVDLAFTRDNQLVARHDWRASYALSLDQELPEGPLTAAQFKRLKINKAFTPMTFKDLCRLMLKHPDAYLVTDTKGVKAEQAEASFFALCRDAREVDVRLLDRIVPQIYNMGMLAPVLKHHPFKSIVFTLYQNFEPENRIIAFSRANGIRIVTMPRWKASARFIAKLKAAGISTYVHTINDASEVSRLRGLGASGFYTDSISPGQFEEIRAANRTP